MKGMREAVKGLTDAEASKLNKKTAQTFLEIRRNLPSSREMEAVARAGQSKKGWYRNSTQALQGVFGEDAPRFTALLAATSPQLSVESNLINALNIWKNWTAAGRPTDRETILDIMGDSVEGDKGRGSVLDAWVNNSLRALQAENPNEIMLSGPKVDSFMRNLSGVMNEVTNDTWMARYGGVPQSVFGGSQTLTDPGKSTAYLAMNSKIRQAADRLSQITGEPWEPAEVQETVWSWAYGLRNRDKGARIMDNLQQLRDPDVAAAPDFGQLLQEPKYAGPLSEAGYDEQLGALAERPSVIQPGSEEFTQAALERDPKAIRRAARRIALGFGERPAAALAAGTVGAGALGGAEEAEAGPIQWAKRMTDDDLLEEMDYLTKQGKEDSTEHRILEDEYNVRLENAAAGPYEERPESWRVMDPEGYDPEVHAMLESHGFADMSYHNDGAPKFVNPRTNEVLWINYKDPESREFAKDEPRFMLESWDDDLIGPRMAPINENLSTDNPQELITRIQRAAPPVAAGALGAGALAESEEAEAGTTGLVKNIRRGEFPIGVERVQSPSDAANVFAGLRKSPQEEMQALVLGPDGEPLEIVRHTRGTSNASSVEPSALAGSVLDVPGGQSVYFGHNHPSGRIDPSGSDRLVTESLREILEPAGMESRGMMIVGPGGLKSTHMWTSPYGEQLTDVVQTTPGRRAGTVPYSQREYRRLPQDQPTITSDTELKRALGEYGPYMGSLDNPQSGVLFLNNRNEPAGALQIEDPMNLRGGAYADMLRAAHRGNAIAGVPISRNYDELENMTAALEAGGLDVVDAMRMRGDSDYVSLRGTGVIGGSNFGKGEFSSMAPLAAAGALGAAAMSPEEAEAGVLRELTKADFDKAAQQRVLDKIANMGGGADEQFLENELDTLIRDTLSPSGEYDYMADPYPPEEWGDRLRDLSARMRQGELAPELQQAGLRSPEVANIVDQIAEGFDAELAEVVPEGADPAEYGAEYLRGVYEQSFPAWGSQAREIFQQSRRQPTGQLTPFPGPGTTGAVAGAAGLGALAAPEEAEAAPFGTLRALSGMPTQRVYHGSPAEFDTFRMQEMGSGEGAQAYGEGLYFSTSPGVAESYREALTSEQAPQRWLSDSGQAFDLNEGGDFDRAELINFALEGADGDVEGALRNLEWYEQNVDDMVAMGADRDENVRAYREAADELRRMQAEGGDILRRDVPEGSLFEVEVPAREQLLDYDLPLREQPEQVRGALGNLLESQLGLTGEEYYKRLGEGASGQLREMGIPGLTYRGLESGEQNVVMFDENLINAVSRNEAPISRGMTGFAEEEVELGLPDEPEWMGQLKKDQAGFAALGPMATAGGIGALTEPSISDEFIGAGKAAGSLASAVLTGLGAEGQAFLSAINPMFSTEQALEQAARARAVQPRLTDDPRAAPYLQGFVGALDTAVEDVARGFGKQSPLYQNVAPYRGLYDFAEEDLPALYERLPRRLRLALESGANIAF